MPGFLTGLVTKIAGDKAADIVTSVGNIADEYFNTPEEKEAFKAEVAKEINRHLESLSAEQTKEFELIVKDMDSARNREVQIATSEKAPKLNKLITPILALFVTAGFFTLLALAVNKSFPADNAALLNIMTGSLGTAWIGIIGYYFGSSMGSQKKSDTIDKMVSQ